jgi:LacI family transcriptional regulator
LLDDRQEVVRYVKRARVPVVDLSVYRRDVPLPRVAGDHVQIGVVAAEHFLERAFRHFAWFSTKDDPVVRLRLEGFSTTLATAGHDCTTWIFQSAHSRRGNEWIAKLDFLRRRLRTAPKPLAVFTFHDYDAATVLDACADAGLSVPDDVAILGSDNNEMICDTVRVPLSSVNHDLEGLGYQGATLLGRLMNGKAPPGDMILVPPKGVTVRRSTDLTAINYEPARKAVNLLREKYRRLDAAEVVCEASGLSRRQLDRAFLKHLGRSVHDLLTTIRIARAKELLQRTDYKVADVSAMCGFKTPQYFNTFFRKSVGTTPNRFRARHQYWNE